MSATRLGALLLSAVLGVVLLVVVLIGSIENRCPAPTGPTGGSGAVAPAGSLVTPTRTDTTTMTSGFGQRWGTRHRGADYAGDVGTPIYAYTDGRVTAAGPASGFGNWIIIDHQIDGRIVSTVYGHMFDDGVLVKVGEHVSAGQQIGAIGNHGHSTGPHLHFEVWEGGRLPDGVGTAVDPVPWVDRAQEPGSGSRPSGSGNGIIPSPSDSNRPGLETYSHRQLALAEQTVAVGESMGVSEQGIIVALATAGQESTYRMLANSTVPESLSYPHDGVGNNVDSVNQYQQRVGIWGTTAELMNPVTANVKFYEHLLHVPGWETMPVTVAAQTVQGSAHPHAYAKWETVARALYAEFTGAGKDLTTAELARITSSTAAITVAVGGTLGADCTPEGGSHGNGRLAAGPFGQKVIEAASRWLGTPYAWGGGDFSGPTTGISDGGGAGDAHGDFTKVGFDCSGLTLYAVYQASGGAITLPHYTGDPAQPGQLYDPRGRQIPLDQKQPGDLIYFGSGGSTHHVGIYYGVRDGRDMLLSAPQSGDVVSIEPLSNWNGEDMYVRRFGTGTTTDQQIQR